MPTRWYLSHQLLLVLHPGRRSHSASPSQVSKEAIRSLEQTARELITQNTLLKGHASDSRDATIGALMAETERLSARLRHLELIR